MKLGEETEQLIRGVSGVVTKQDTSDLQLLDGALCDNPYHLVPIALVQRAM